MDKHECTDTKPEGYNRTTECEIITILSGEGNQYGK